MLQLLIIMTMARDAARFCLNFVSCFFGVCVCVFGGRGVFVFFCFDGAKYVAYQSD